MSFKAFPEIKLLAFYSLVYLATRLVTLTLVTYFLIPTQATMTGLSDVILNAEIPIVGFAAIATFLLLVLSYPLSTVHWRAIADPALLLREFLPGMSTGALWGSAIVVGYVFTGFYHYLGTFTEYEDPYQTLVSVFFRGLLLFCSILFEEYLFRARLVQGLRHQFPAWLVLFISASLSLALKMIQFDLSFDHGLLQLFTWFLLYLLLATRVWVSGDYLQGAGFVFGLTFLLHIVFGLPLFGVEFSGLLLFKYSTETTNLMHEVNFRAAQLLTGGLGGPLSGFVLQFLLLVVLLKWFISERKILWVAISKGR